MSFQENTIKEYCTLLAAKKSTPGGGSALGITLELACSLCMMVINFTLDKKGYEKHQDRLKELANTIGSFTKMSEELADQDSITFKDLMASFKIGDSDLISDRAMKACLVPFNLYLATEQVENVARELILIGNKNVVSDAKIAADLCVSIYHGCKLNIEANLPSIKDSVFIGKMKTIY